MQKLLDKLVADFPDLKFVKDSHCRWSPADQTITYATTGPSDKAKWSLLHELAHALLQHATYTQDIELIGMEVDAWHRAEQLAESYGIAIKQTYIQDCLDTYRDWLHQRSTCTQCQQVGLEQTSGHYRCINCGYSWKVGHDRFSRIYRKKIEPPIKGTLQTN